MGHFFTGIKQIVHHIVGTSPKGVGQPSVRISEEPIPPDHDDQQFLTALRQMDSYIEEEANYAEWEAHFFSMQQTCCTRYAHWLKAKGVPQNYCQEFPQCIEVYLASRYQYGSGTLKQISSRTIKKFLMNFLPRKVMLEPTEYLLWLPALKHFYMFLGEKGYLDDPAAIMRLFEKIEPRVIRFIKKQS